MALHSDQQNADAQLHVEFYEYPGQPPRMDGPWKGKPFVRIMVPGDKNNIFDQPATEEHKLRFHRQWLHFQMQTNQADVVGTPLLLWHQERPEEISFGQLEELNIMKFQTVEQIALASDAQINRIGMGGGGLRERARSFLAAKSTQASSMELDQAKSEIAALKSMVQALMEREGPKQAAPTRRAKKAAKKPAWRAKTKVKEDNGQHTPATGAVGL